MKKALSLIFAFAMIFALAIPAFAAESVTTITQDSQDKTGTTTLTYSVAKAYSVSLPADATVAKDTATTLEVALAAGMLIGWGEKLTVAISGDLDNLYLEADTQKTAGVAYDLKLADVDVTSFTKILDVAAGTQAEQKASLTAKVTGDPAYSGDYKATLTFTVAVA